MRKIKRFAIRWGWIVAFALALATKDFWAILLTVVLVSAAYNSSGSKDIRDL